MEGSLQSLLTPMYLMGGVLTLAMFTWLSAKKAGLSQVKFYAMVDQAAMALNVIEFKDVSCTNKELQE